MLKIKVFVDPSVVVSSPAVSTDQTDIDPLASVNPTDDNVTVEVMEKVVCGVQSSDSGQDAATHTNHVSTEQTGNVSDRGETNSKQLKILLKNMIQKVS